MPFLGYKYDSHIKMFVRSVMTDEKLKRLESVTDNAFSPAKGKIPRFRWRK